MTDDNLDDTQQGSVGKQINIGKYYTKDEVKEIWNAAIEAAALKIDEISPYGYMVAAVRSLKK